MVDESPPLLTVKEAAKRLGRDRSTVRRWIKQGSLPAVTMSGRSYIAGAEIERLLRVGHGGEQR